MSNTVEMGRKVLHDSGDLVVYMDISPGEVEIVRIMYPIYPYSNSVKKVIRITKNYAECYIVRDNWNGTGRDECGYIELSEDEFKELYSTAVNVRTVDDLDMVVEKFNELRRRKHSRAVEKFENVADAFAKLEAKKKKGRSKA